MQKIKFMTLEDLLELNANEEGFKLVDVRSNESYANGHIPGAINIPEEEISEKHDSYLNKDDKIVVYCSGYRCSASTRSARILLDLGYGNTLDFKASVKGWLDAGLELEQLCTKLS